MTKKLNIIFPFRSFHNQKFTLKTSFFLCLPLFFNALILININRITNFWSQILFYGLSLLGYEPNIIYSKYLLLNIPFTLPAINIPAHLPNVTLWWASLFITFGIFLFSFLIRDAFTPLKYFLRVLLAIIWLTQIYLMIFPQGLVYNVFLYTKSGFMQILSLLFVIPWMFLLAYYLIGRRFLNKIIITLVTLIYFIILAPFQYLLNACLINLGSLLFMPALFFYLGLMVNVLAVIGFLSYGISIEPRYKKYKVIP